MATELRTLETKALKLPSAARAKLAERLIASLDRLDQTEIERLCLEEAERRYREYKRGKVPARDAEEVIRDARRRNS